MKRRERSGPENLREDDLSVETRRGEMPDGVLPAIEPVTDPRRIAREMSSFALGDREELPQRGGEVARRTSLDRDNIRPVVTINRPAEERVDSSTGDEHREEVLDPTQDENGSETDQA